MKSITNNKYFGFFLVISLFFGSCDDFLEVTPPYTQDAENFFLTQEDYERALVGCYDLLQASFCRFGLAKSPLITASQEVNR